MSLDEKKIKELIDPSKYKFARWTPAEELDYIVQICKDAGISLIVESGTANGWSACYFASEGINVFTYDVVERPQLLDDPLLDDHLFIKAHIGFTVGKFSDEVGRILPIKEEPVCFFIDGDHSRKAVFDDFQAIQKSLKQGDIVIFDDINEIPCLKAVLKIAQETGHILQKKEFPRRKIGVLRWTK